MPAGRTRCPQAGRRGAGRRGALLADRIAATLTQEASILFALIATAADRSAAELFLEALGARLPPDQLVPVFPPDRIGPSERVQRAWRFEASLAAGPPRWTQQQRRGVGRILAPFDARAERHMSAGLLDDFRKLAMVAEGPWFASSGEPATAQAEWLLGGILIPNLVDSVKKHKALAAIRVLAMEASVLYQDGWVEGSYPEIWYSDTWPEDRPDTYSDRPLLYHRYKDGSATLALTDADSLWEDAYGHLPHSHQSLFTWYLPAPR